MANISKTYEGLRDLLISELLYCCCPPGFVTFLKERECTPMEALADVIDCFLEAQSFGNLGKLPTGAPDLTKGAVNTPGKGNREWV